MRGLAAVLALCAGPVMADPLGLMDYDALFEQNADRVRLAANGDQVLALPPATRITRRPDAPGLINGVDLSEGGAPGCYAVLLLDVLAYDHACPDSLGPTERAALATHAITIADFYAANVTPATTPEAVRDRLAALAETRAADWRAAPRWGPAACIPGEEAAPILSLFTSAGMTGILSTALARPRPPVAIPCL